MYWMLGLLSFGLFGMIATGVYLELQPARRVKNAANRWRGLVGANLIVFLVAEMGLLLFGVQDVMANTAAEAATVTEVSTGLGLALIGIGIPTGLATIGAGIAVGPVGAASLAVISEKPEMFGRTLIYLGLAEGIAIYGLVVTILMLGKIG